jgi:tryptophan-rich sensory protein
MARRRQLTICFGQSAGQRDLNRIRRPGEPVSILVSPTAPSRPSFWQRGVLGPIRALLLQGITPNQIAFTLAVSTACSLLPFLGFTSLLNLGVGLWFRLNQPIMQTLNQLFGPVQLVLIIVYVRLGEKIWRAAPMPISVPLIVRSFRADPGAFLQRFGWTGIHAATAWALSVPLIVAALYFPLRDVLRRFAARRPA